MGHQLVHGEDTGWIQSHLFIFWLRIFIDGSHPSKNDPVYLLLDGHATHLKSVEVIDIAHDVEFKKPVSSYNSNEVRNWLCSHRVWMEGQY